MHHDQAVLASIWAMSFSIEESMPVSGRRPEW
jgi:hypothetical protein